MSPTRRIVLVSLLLMAACVSGRSQAPDVHIDGHVAGRVWVVDNPQPAVCPPATGYAAPNGNYPVRVVVKNTDMGLPFTTELRDSKPDFDVRVWTQSNNFGVRFFDANTNAEYSVANLYGDRNKSAAAVKNKFRLNGPGQNIANVCLGNISATGRLNTGPHEMNVGGWRPYRGIQGLFRFHFFDSPQGAPPANANATNLRGRVVEKMQNRGAVQTSAGVAGVKVEIFGAWNDSRFPEFVAEGGTDATGNYTIDLKPDAERMYNIYILSVGGRGFQSATAVLNADAAGDQGEIPIEREEQGAPVPVESAASDTGTPALGGSFGTDLIQALPLGTRRAVDSLAFLLPGVLPAAQTRGPDGPRIGPSLGSAGQFSSNGLRGTDNNFLVDGTDNNDENVGARRQGYLISGPQTVETVAAFAPVTALFDSRYGKAPGAQVDAASRTGSSTLHGQLYSFVTDHRLNALNYFDGEVPSTAGPLIVGRRAVQIDGNPAMPDAIGPRDLPDTELKAGAVVTGAVPGLRQTFFASAFEFDGVRKMERLNFAVPTIPQRGFNGSGATGLPFTGYTGNSYPATVVGDAFFSLYPFPNNPQGPYGPNTYTRDRPANGDGWEVYQRIDHVFHFGGTSFLGLRYNYSNEDDHIPETGGALDSGLHVQAQIQSFTGFMSSTPLSFLANTLRFSWGKARLRFLGDRDPSLIPSDEFPGDPFLLNAALLANTTLQNTGPVTYVQKGLGDTESVTGPIGQLNVAGFSSIGADPARFPQRRADSTLQFADSVAITRGRHALTAGAEVWLIELNNNVNPNARPAVSFNGEPAVSFGAPGSSPSQVLLDPDSNVAAGLQASVSQTFTTVSDTSQQLHRPQVDLFVQDDVRISPTLKLSAGFRFSMNGAPSSSDGRFEKAYNPNNGVFITELNEALQTCLSNPTFPAIFTQEICNSVDQSLHAAFPPGFDSVYRAAPFGYNPRAGLAWDPTGHGTTAIRIGAGVYSGQLPAVIISESSALFPEFLPVRYYSNPAVSTSGAFLNLASPYPYVSLVPGTLNLLPQGANVVNIFNVFQLNSGLLNPLSTVSIVPTEPGAGLKNPTAYEAGATLERTFSYGIFLSAGYVAGLGRHLTDTSAPNAYAPRFQLASGNIGQYCGAGVAGLCPSFSAGLVGNLAGADPTVYSSVANSEYHSLQLQLRERGTWLQTGSAFTWSHSIDNASDLFDTAGSFALPQDPNNPAGERASSSFDTRLRFVTWFAASSRAGNLLLKDWQLSGILTLQTGQPYTVNTVYDLNWEGTGTVRLNSIAGLAGPGVGSAVPGLGRQTRVVLTESGTMSQLLCQSYPCDGAIGRNTFRAAGLENLDLALTRIFSPRRLPEGHRIQARLEAYNALNRTNFAIPVRILEEPGFGNSVSTASPNRRLQFSLRYSF